VIADDAQSFAASILALLRDRELRRNYEQNAAELAARFDWSRIAQRFADVLQQVVTKSSRTGQPGTPVLPV